MYMRRKRNRKVDTKTSGLSLRDKTGKGVYYKRSGGLHG